MTTYRYKALSPNGAKVTGVVEAYDEFDAVAKIKERCPIVEKITPVEKGRREPIRLNEPLWVEDKSLAMVSSQFAILLRAGLPMVRVVELIAGQSGDALMRRILNETAADVAAGYSLAQSFENHGKKLPVTFIETVRAGEESGTLEASFQRLHAYYDKSSKIKKKVRSAMTYPILLVLLAIVVVAIVMVVLVPSMLTSFESIGSALPLPTRMLMAMSNFFQRYWLALLLGICMVILAVALYGRTARGAMRLARLKLRLPVLGRINVMKAASQFANTLSTLLAAGLTLTRALEITARVLDNRAVGDSVLRSVLGVQEGKRLGDILRGSPYLPPMLIEMTGVGEESGSLDETLSTVGAYYDSEVERTSNHAVSLLEPIMTIALGVFVAFIVVAIYLPMFQMQVSFG